MEDRRRVIAPPDVVLINGTVLTVDPQFYTAEALAVTGPLISAVGSSDELLGARGPKTHVIDLEGRTVSPGIIDSHMHFVQLGRRREKLFLNDTVSSADAIALVAEQATEKQAGDWVLGAGWHTARWGEADYPDGHALSDATPDNPVYLTGMSWHAAWVNRQVMEMAGITKETPDPEGGTVVRDPLTGEPTGVFMETATQLVEAVLPAESPEELRRLTRGAAAAALSMGICTVHDAAAVDDEIAVYRTMVDEGEMPLRLYLMYLVPGLGRELDALLAGPPEISERLTLRTVKVFSDGALGGRGAALLAPYADDPSTSGLLRRPSDEIGGVVGSIIEAGYQVAYHAIGDRACRHVLDAVEALGSAAADARPRIEHAQIVDPSDATRLGALGVIGSVQPLHCLLDVAFMEDRLGADRMDRAYPWRSMIDAGATLVANADAPFSPVWHSDPLVGMYAAVTRAPLDGQQMTDDFLAQRVSRREAIEMYTINAARAGFEEDRKGSIEVGKLADLAVWSNDIASIPAESLLDTSADLTIVGGRVVFDRHGLAGDPDSDPQ